MWRDAGDAVLDMLQACDEAMQFAADGDLDDLHEDLLRLRAIERCLSILGEAAKRVPEDVRVRHAVVPWRSAAGLRDVLVHDYFGIDLAVLKQVIREELPPLREHLRAVAEAEGWLRADKGTQAT